MSDTITIFEYIAVFCLCISPCYLYCCSYRNRLNIIENDTQNRILQEKNNKTYEI